MEDLAHMLRLELVSLSLKDEACKRLFSQVEYSLEECITLASPLVCFSKMRSTQARYAQSRLRTAEKKHGIKLVDGGKGAIPVRESADDYGFYELIHRLWGCRFYRDAARLILLDLTRRFKEEDFDHDSARPTIESAVWCLDLEDRAALATAKPAGNA